MSRKHPVLCLLMTLAFGLATFACAGGDDDDDESAGDDDADDDTSGEEVWTDPDTALGWQNGETVGNESMIAADAATYCDALTWAGFDDWRLPTIGELRGLVRGCEETAAGGSCQVRDDCTALDCWTVNCDGCSSGAGLGADGAYVSDELKGQLAGHWSTTDVSGLDSATWTADFQTAQVDFNDQSERTARCVRGAGSGITDETGEAYRVSVVVFVGTLTPGDPSPLQGAHCELIDLDGEAPAEPVTVKTDEYGWCAMAFNQPFDTYSVKLTASGFQDTYVYHYPRFNKDADGNHWGWITTMQTAEVTAGFMDLVGLSPESGTGIVSGRVQWAPATPSPSVGAQWVGCAEVSPVVDDFYYVDAVGELTNAVTSTTPANAAFCAFNQDPGAMEFTATVDDLIESTGEFEVHPDAWVNVMIVYPDSEYPENPTPDSCV